MLISLEAFWCKCDDCGGTSEVYKFPDFYYGDRIMRTTDGLDMGLVKCLEDEVFGDVSDLVSTFCKRWNISTQDHIKLFNSVFGITCDPINGKEIDPLKGPVCRLCKSNRITHAPYNPPKVVEMDIPMITHEHWSGRDPKERAKTINEHLERLWGAMRS